MKRLGVAFLLLHYAASQHPAAAQAWQRQAPDTDAVTGRVSHVVSVATADGEAILVLTCFRNVPQDSDPILQLRLYSPRHVFDFHSDNGEQRVRLTWRADTGTVRLLDASVFKDGRNAFLFETDIDDAASNGRASGMLFSLLTDTRPHTLALSWPVYLAADQTARWRLRPNAAMRAVISACQP